MRIHQRFWVIESAGWSIDQSEECIALCPADIDAALQFSCHRKSAGDVTDEELHAFAAEDVSSYGATLEAVSIGPFTGYAAEFEHEGVFWRRWWIASGRTHLFITYNCSAQNRSHHFRVVDWILSTLQVLDDT